MPLLPLIVGGLQAASSLGNYWSSRKNRTPLFENTALGRYYSRISKEGAISPTARRTLLSEYGSTAGNVAANTRAGIRGGLANMGMERSIAGISALAQPGAQLQEGIGAYSRGIDLSNEESKQQALEALAQGKDMSRAQRRGETASARMGLFSGLAGAAGNVYSAWQQQGDKALDDEYKKAQIGLINSQSGYYSGRNQGKSFPNITDDELINLSASDIARLAADYGISYEDLIDAQEYAKYTRGRQGQ